MFRSLSQGSYLYFCTLGVSSSVFTMNTSTIKTIFFIKTIFASFFKVLHFWGLSPNLLVRFESFLPDFSRLSGDKFWIAAHDSLYKLYFNTVLRKNTNLIQSLPRISSQWIWMVQYLDPIHRVFQIRYLAWTTLSHMSFIKN